MRVWIDLENTPHVPFFLPIIRYLESEGHDVYITVRDYGYTKDLATESKMVFTVIGSHLGKNKLLKVLGLIFRVLRLLYWSIWKKFDIAISHGSRGLVLTSALIRVPSVTIYDYEFVSSGIFNSLSSKILLPDLIPDEVVVDRESVGRKIVKYPGLKEELYLSEFTPDECLLEELGVDNSKIVVLLRPPATTAHYHNPVSEQVFEEVVGKISLDHDVVGIVAPRTQEQAEALKMSLHENDGFYVLEKPVNGLNLIWNSDLIVGGGGTMNREAVVLGVPVYSIFTGKKGSIDNALEKDGKLRWIRNVEDIEQIQFIKRRKDAHSLSREAFKNQSDKLIEFICKQLLSIKN